jgi:uncharacterized protein YndB with AHSA1/START domain
VRASLTFRIRVDAPVESVFAFFTDAANVAQWLGTRVQVDPRPLGAITAEHETDVMEGRFLQIVPYEWVSFTWGWRSGPYADRLPPGSSIVTVSFDADGPSTWVTLACTDWPPKNARPHHVRGRSARRRPASACS